jgi:hypothetical protein
MQNDYYQNIVYPLQDSVLSVIDTLPVDFYLILEQFPAEKLQEIIWIGNPPVTDWFYARIKQIIKDNLEGSENNPDTF